jgi:hypothetical protein
MGPMLRPLPRTHSEATRLTRGRYSTAAASLARSARRTLASASATSGWSAGVAAGKVTFPTGERSAPGIASTCLPAMPRASASCARLTSSACSARASWVSASESSARARAASTPGRRLCSTSGLTIRHRHLHVELAPHGPRTGPAAIGRSHVDLRRLPDRRGHVPRRPHARPGLEDAGVERAAARGARHVEEPGRREERSRHRVARRPVELRAHADVGQLGGSRLVDLAVGGALHRACRAQRGVVLECECDGPFEREPHRDGRLCGGNARNDRRHQEHGEGDRKAGAFSMRCAGR